MKKKKKICSLSFILFYRSKLWTAEKKNYPYDPVWSQKIWVVSIDKLRNRFDLGHFVFKASTSYHVYHIHYEAFHVYAIPRTSCLVGESNFNLEMNTLFGRLSIKSFWVSILIKRYKRTIPAI